MSSPPDRIADLTAQHAVLATAIVLNLGDQREHLRLWAKTTRGFTPSEFLMLWNEVQSDVSRTHGVHSLVTRIQIFDDKKVEIEYRDLTGRKSTGRGQIDHNSN